jgi:hypothetical protein
MRAVISRHDALLSRAFEARGGVIFKTLGDGVCAAFATPEAAAAAALEAQLELGEGEWGAGGPPSVRMAIHTGAAEPVGDDYVGPAANRAARILSAGHGGQVLISAAAAELVRQRLPEAAPGESRAGRGPAAGEPGALPRAGGRTRALRYAQQPGGRAEQAWRGGRGDRRGRGESGTETHLGRSAGNGRLARQPGASQARGGRRHRGRTELPGGFATLHRARVAAWDRDHPRAAGRARAGPPRVRAGGAAAGACRPPARGGRRARAGRLLRAPRRARCRAPRGAGRGGLRA